MGIEAFWDDLLAGRHHAAHRRVSEDHPLDLYAAVSETGRVGLLALSDERPPSPPPYGSVTVSIGVRTDGRFATLLTLDRESLRPLFARLCDDLIEASRSAPPHSSASAFLLEHLARWKRLLSFGPSDALDASAVRGLVGELLALRAFLAQHPAAVAVEAWKGPLGAPRDFEFGLTASEVKTVRPGSHVASISSPEQLDYPGGELTLDVIELADALDLSADSFSLSSLVAAIRLQIAHDVLASDLFETRLHAAGYEDLPQYDSSQFRLIDRRSFGVRAGFPRILRRDLPSAVLDLTYEISLPGCEAFQIPL